MAHNELEPPLVQLFSEAPSSAATPVLGDEYHLEPRTAPRIVDLAVEVLRRNFLACVALSILFWLPIRALTPLLMSLAPKTGMGEGLIEFWIAMSGYSVVAALVEVLATMTLTLISYEALVGGRLAPKAALLRTVKRSFALLGLFLVKFLLLFSGAMLLAVLGIMCPPLFLAAVAYWIYFSWKLSVAPCALMLEDLGVFETIKRSFKLTEGSFLRWLGIYCLASLLTIGLTSGSQLSDNLIIRASFLEMMEIPPLWFDVIFIPISSVFAGLATAIVAVATTAFYLDNRIRTEGLDLRMRLERRARRVAVEPLA
jgi:hypothetical protein